MKKLSSAEKLAFLIGILYLADLFNRKTGWYEILLTVMIAILLIVLVIKSLKNIK